MAEKRDPKTGFLLEEPGIKEEGFLDFAEPYKQKLSDKLRSAIPSATAGALAAEAVDLLIPSSPEGLAAKVGRVGGGLRSAMRAPREIKETSYLDKVISKKKPSAYESLKTRSDVEESRQKALDFLESVGIKPKK